MKIGIIDIETTGFLNKGGFIVEVGIVSLDTDTGVVIDEFESVCREDGMTAKDRKAWIFSNSDLTIESIRNAPNLKDIMLPIQEKIDGFDASTAYNKAFDFGFLRNRGVVIHNEVTCPMIAASDVVKIKSSWGYKWPSVEEAWDFFFPDSEYVELHRGADDARHEALIVNELFKLGLIKGEAK